MDNSSLRLQKFEVVGLYGEFNHCIEFRLEEHVTIIIAPNGSGKTICLKLINSLINCDWLFLDSIDFHSATYHFSDDTIILARKEKSSISSRKEDYEGYNISVSLTLIQKNQKKEVKWMPKTIPVDMPIGWIERDIPYLVRIGIRSWRDMRDGNVLSLREVIAAFPQYMPSSYRKNLADSENKEIVSFLKRMKCKLIETQRLIVIENLEEEERVSRRRVPSNYFAISKKSEVLKNIIADNIKKYAFLSQALDQSFPRRVLSKYEEQVSVETKLISDEIQKLENRRKSLMDVGVLDKEDSSSLSIKSKKFDKALASILTVYIEDSKEKLQSLELLKDRILLFRDLMQARLGDKKVSINKEKGIVVKYKEHNIPLESLSSGEQHQLILLF